MIKTCVIDLLGLCGVGCLSYGAYMYSNPLGLMVLGVSLIGLAVLANRAA